MRTLVLAVLLLTATATPAQPFEPCDRRVESCKPLPWYRGDENSKLRLRLDFGPARLVLKAPLKREKMVELRLVIRF